MKNTLGFIAEVKARYGIESDYAAAKLLGVSKMTMSHYRNGKGLLGDESALKVAELLDLDPAYVLACIAAERAKQPEVKAAWKHTAEMLYGLAAVLAVVAVLPFVPGMNADSLSGAALLGFTWSGDCILCQTTNPLYWLPFIFLATLALLALPRSRRR